MPAKTLSTNRPLSSRVTLRQRAMRPSRPARARRGRVTTLRSAPRERPFYHVVIGGSAGAIESFRCLIRELPADFPAAIYLVIHISPTSPTMLPHIFGRCTRMHVVQQVDDGMETRLGHIYIAPPDFHLLLRPGQVRLVRGPRENGHRPAVDPLFRSAAATYGPGVIGVILSGSLDDGASGLSAIKQSGGLAVVQDPMDAMFPEMPRNAIAGVKVDRVLPLARMPALLRTLVQKPVPRRRKPVPPHVLIETEVAAMNKPNHQMNGLGKPSTLTCPQCNGALWERRDGTLITFRCRVGHAFTAESLEVAQSELLESALWSAVRALEEKRNLLQRLAERAHAQNSTHTARSFENQAKDLKSADQILRDLLLKRKY